jgi:hypothetical protein
MAASNEAAQFVRPGRIAVEKHELVNWHRAQAKRLRETTAHNRPTWSADAEKLAKWHDGAAEAVEAFWGQMQSAFVGEMVKRETHPWSLFNTIGHFVAIRDGDELPDDEYRERGGDSEYAVRMVVCENSCFAHRALVVHGEMAEAFRDGKTFRLEVEEAGEGKKVATRP